MEHFQVSRSKTPHSGAQTCESDRVLASRTSGWLSTASVQLGTRIGHKSYFPSESCHPMGKQDVPAYTSPYSRAVLLSAGSGAVVCRTKLRSKLGSLTRWNITGRSVVVCRQIDLIPTLRLHASFQIAHQSRKHRIGINVQNHYRS
jgi:hypothetical protein